MTIKDNALSVLIYYVASSGSDDDLQVAPEASAGAADVVLGHGIPVLNDGGLESIDVRVVNSSGLGLVMHPKCVVKGLGIWAVGGPFQLFSVLKMIPQLGEALFKSLKRALQHWRWVIFILSVKRGLSTLTRLFPQAFLTVLCTVMAEIPRSLVCDLMDLRGGHHCHCLELFWV